MEMEALRSGGAKTAAHCWGGEAVLHNEQYCTRRTAQLEDSVTLSQKDT